MSEQAQGGFLFGQQFSTLELKTRLGTQHDAADMKVNNYHGISTYNFGYSDSQLRPFIFGGLGATNYSPSDADGFPVESNTRFSTTWGGRREVLRHRQCRVQLHGAVGANIHQLERCRDLVQPLLARRGLGIAGSELLEPVRSVRGRELRVLGRLVFRAVSDGLGSRWASRPSALSVVRVSVSGRLSRRPRLSAATRTGY